MSPELPFTGERFTPEGVREIWYEHWHRYAFALPLARARRVLDAACGEGYGADVLAQHATQVTAVDVSAEAVTHARSRYGQRRNLRFEQADVTALDALPDASFDLIVSFETLEHLEAQESMIAGFARLLAPGGILLLSSPDKATYSDATGFRNEHHVRELYRGQLLELLAPHFPAVRLFGQKLLFQSAIWSLDHEPERVTTTTATPDAGQLDPGLRYAPLYFIAVCAREQAVLDATGQPDLSLFGDSAESVYRHYEHEIRKNMQAGAVLAQMQQRLASSLPAAAPTDGRWSRWWKKLSG